MLAFEKGDTLNATSYFERAVRLTNDSVTRGELLEIYILLARMFDQKGEPEGALRNYNKALEIDPNQNEAKQFVEKHKRDEEQKKMIEMMQKMNE